MQRARIGKIIQQGIQGAGQAGEQTRNNEGDPDMALYRNAQKARTPLVFAYRQQGSPKRRTQDQCHDADRDREYQQHQVVISFGVTQYVDLRKTQVYGQTRQAGQSVIARSEEHTSELQSLMRSLY